MLDMRAEASRCTAECKKAQKIVVIYGFESTRKVNVEHETSGGRVEQLKEGDVIVKATTKKKTHLSFVNDGAQQRLEL